MRILTFALCLLCFSVSAQNNSINVYPWNPDSDNDNQIGVDDLQSFLTVYGNSFGLPPEPCTYDGTSIEDFFLGIHAGLVVLDSVYIEYELQDISSFYISGCPELYTDTISFVENNTCHVYGFADSGDNWFKYDLCGLKLIYDFTPSSGLYKITLRNDPLALLGFSADGFFGDHNVRTDYSSLPWPSTWVYDENGISLEISTSDPWTDYANYLHILPYWHYADE